MADSREKAMAAVKQVGDLFAVVSKKFNYNGYDKYLMENVRLVDAHPNGKVEWELAITPFYQNVNGVMHGGAAGVIFDMCTTMALCPISRPGYWDFLGGVTRSMNISYLKGVPIGTTVRIRAHVVQHGRTMALIRGTMESVDGKKTYATVEHHKVGVPTQEQHLALLKAMGVEAEIASGTKEKPKL